MTTLWRVEGDKLVPTSGGRLDAERNLQDWIERDPSILDPDLMLIGREVETGFGRIDLLGINGDGWLQIIELKRGKTPREIVAQILDYASWVSKLTTSDVHRIAQEYESKKLQSANFAERFRVTFDKSLPETLNASHRMIAVASALDPSSKRIIEYLSEVHNVGINTAFFKVFSDGDRRYLAADWLLDQQEVVDRSEARTKAPWAGDWYANVGDGQSRSWEDMRKYDFLAAGGGRFYSGRLDQLSTGERVYAYQKQRGYVGYGVVMGEPVLAKEFLVDGKPLLEQQLIQPNLSHDQDDSELAEYVVPIAWKKTFPISEAKTFPGAFANQNIVCRLRDQATLDFLYKVFIAN